MEHEDWNFFQRRIEARLDRLTEARSCDYIRRFARHGDGTPDERLAYRIDREIHRRAAMSRELDIYEPLRWAGMQFLLSAAVGAGIKATTEKSFSGPALATLVVTTALTSAVQLARLLPRFDAALKGGLDTALAMHAFDEAHRIPDDIDWLRGQPDGLIWADRLARSRLPRGILTR